MVIRTVSPANSPEVTVPVRVTTTTAPATVTVLFRDSVLMAPVFHLTVLVSVPAERRSTQLRGAAGTMTTQVPEVRAGVERDTQGPNESGPVHVDEQLALIGEPTPVRIPAVEWSVWLANESVQARYWAKVYRTGSTEDCWFFFGGISSTGHASFRAASRPGRTRRGTVPGHLYGYQLAHGVIPRLGWGTDSPTVCHTCDNHSCQQPTHLRLGTAAENRAEWVARHKDPSSPLADVRGPAGRSRAIGAAIRAGQKGGDSAAEIAARVHGAVTEGRPLRTPNEMIFEVVGSLQER